MSTGGRSVLWERRAGLSDAHETAVECVEAAIDDRDGQWDDAVSNCGSGLCGQTEDRWHTSTATERLAAGDTLKAV